MSVTYRMLVFKRRRLIGNSSESIGGLLVGHSSVPGKLLVPPLDENLKCRLFRTDDIFLFFHFSELLLFSFFFSSPKDQLKSNFYYPDR